MTVPAVLVAGLAGGDGKTLISVGLAAAWHARGRSVATFKKGPDYIDAAWLSRAAGIPCRNLDLFLMTPETVTRSFASSLAGADVAVIEGNRGLFDGVDGQGTYSTAELAKLLRIPVLLVVDCTKRTRTAAALVLGCRRMDPRVPIAGVILNRIGGPRHEAVLREAMEDVCRVPVVGSLPRLRRAPFPERHLGLVPPAEHGGIDEAIRRAAQVVADHLDLDRILELARAAPATVRPSQGGVVADEPGRARVGVFRDAAFQFYYPENLEALRREGAEIVEISPIRDRHLPQVDALYIGGGFPETLAPRLAENTSFRESVRRAVEDDLPVYAECGGAVFLGEELLMDGETFPMAAAVPAVFGFAERPQGHGYAVIETVKPNPFFEVGDTLRGHEFHYTYPRAVIAEDVRFVFRVHRGCGYGAGRDGLCYRNVVAAYTHVHALGTRQWAPSLVRAAVDRRCACPVSGVTA